MAYKLCKETREWSTSPIELFPAVTLPRSNCQKKSPYVVSCFKPEPYAIMVTSRTRMVIKLGIRTKNTSGERVVHEDGDRSGCFWSANFTKTFEPENRYVSPILAIMAAVVDRHQFYFVFVTQKPKHESCSDCFPYPDNSKPGEYDINKEFNTQKFHVYVNGLVQLRWYKIIEHYPRISRDLIDTLQADAKVYYFAGCLLQRENRKCAEQSIWLRKNHNHKTWICRCV